MVNNIVTFIPSNIAADISAILISLHDEIRHDSQKTHHLIIFWERNNEQQILALDSSAHPMSLNAITLIQNVSTNQLN